MATGLERLLKHLDAADEKKAEAETASNDEVSKLKARIAELEEQNNEHLAIFQRVADFMDGMEGGEEEPGDAEMEADAGDGEEKSELETALARIAELEGKQGTDDAGNSSPSTSDETPTGTVPRKESSGTALSKPRQRKSARNAPPGTSRRTQANLDSMSLEELAQFGEEVVDPAMKAGRAL